MSERRHRLSEAPQSGAERREWERAPLCITAEMIGRDEICVSLSQNISGGGMFLLLPGAVQLGDVIKIQFRLRGRDILVNAEVVWASHRRQVASLRQLPVGVGVKFVDIHGEDRELVLQYVNAVMTQR